MQKRKRKPRRDSDNCSIVNRSVSFNVEDPFQAQLLEAVDTWTNFSGSVKRLLAASLNDGSTLSQNIYSPEFVTPELRKEQVPAAAQDWDPTELF